MEPDSGGGGGVSRHALSHEPENEAGEHVAGARRCQLGRRVGVDRGAAVRRRDHRVAALEHDDGAALGRGGARARKPVARMAEMIGMLGTAGFFGIVAGTQLGDLLLGTPSVQRWQVDCMFLVAGTLALCAAPFACSATFVQAPPRPRRRPPMRWLLRRYHPGTVLLVGVAMGAGISLPAIFLRTYAAELGIVRIGAFFALYAPTAIATRLLTRRLPERFGLPPMILVGLGALAVSQLLFLLVGSTWQLVVPGIGYGIAHAILFPATVAAGSQAFPNRHRGLGTVLMLATFDVGQLVGAPLAGVIVHFSSVLGLPGYPTLFVSTAGILGAVAVVYAASRRGTPSRAKRGRPSRRVVDEPVQGSLVQTVVDG